MAKQTSQRMPAVVRVMVPLGTIYDPGLFRPAYGPCGDFCIYIYVYREPRYTRDPNLDHNYPAKY